MKRAWEKGGFDPNISIKKLPTTVSALIFFFHTKKLSVFIKISLAFYKVSLYNVSICRLLRADLLEFTEELLICSLICCTFSARQVRRVNIWKYFF